MKVRHIKVIIIIIFLFSGIVSAYTQKPDISGTIQYITDKINNNKSLFDDQYAKYVWEISGDVKLTITRYWNDNFESSQSVFVKMLDIKNIQIIDNDDSEYSYSIVIHCIKEEKAVIKTWENSTKSSSVIYIKFSPNKDVARQLKNAIEHLIRLSEEKTEYKTN